MWALDDTILWIVLEIHKHPEEKLIRKEVHAHMRNSNHMTNHTNRTNFYAIHDPPRPLHARPPFKNIAIILKHTIGYNINIYNET